MARANRHYLPEHVWRITHRCYQQEFLIKFSKVRINWLRWLFEEKNVMVWIIKWSNPLFCTLNQTLYGPTW